MSLDGMPNALPNELIVASAGSGKTWQLTNRFIALLAQQHIEEGRVHPERIAALTFTRKAAGEFFEAILEKLATAAVHAGEREALAGGAEGEVAKVLASLGGEDYEKLLAGFIEGAPRVFLGTLDSFFTAVVGCFPMELGLAGEVRVMDEGEEQGVREEVLQGMMTGLWSGYGHSGADQGWSELVEGFREATFGKEEARVGDALLKFFEDYHGLYLEAPEAAAWGVERTIWPEGFPWAVGKLDFVVEVKSLVEGVLERFEMKENHAVFWEEFAEQAAEVSVGALPKRVGYFLERFLLGWEDICAGSLEVKVNRKAFRLEGELCKKAERVTRYLVCLELMRRLAETRGVFRLTTLFEESYAQEVRRRGRLAFSDLGLVLGGGAAGGKLELGQDSGTGRLEVAYRLDARYDHWLLDEFQDTSRLQWGVVRGLLEEALMDASGRRSVFVVGDEKQSIYTWRGGDATLFGELSERYGGGSERALRERPLSMSWRSTQAVLEPVNAIFGNSAVLEEVLPPGVLERWRWREHSVAPKNVGKMGYTAWLDPTGVEAAEGEEEWRVIRALLDEVRPLERGLSCAVLVQRNDKARELYEYLRREGDVAVRCETQSNPATDHPLPLALLSLLRVVEHPADVWAWKHLEMTPLSDGLRRKRVVGASGSAMLHEELEELGYEGFFRAWAEDVLKEDAYAKEQTEGLLELAREFDRRGGGGIGDFLRLAERAKYSARAAGEAVQIMTIHKAKGLTFDMVVVAAMDGDSMGSFRDSVMVMRQGQEREPQWVLRSPRKEIVEADRVLSPIRKARKVDVALEQLCKWYVALTRAARANYLVGPPPKKTSKSRNFLYLLEQALGSDAGELLSAGGIDVPVLYESQGALSTREWFATSLAKGESEAKPWRGGRASEALGSFGRRVRLARRLPSSHEEGDVSAASYLAREGARARNLGTEVHALFEKIAWWDDTWNPEDEKGFSREAVEEFHAALCEEGLMKHLRLPALEPGGEAIFWREKNFEVVLDGVWISGTFDRVHLLKDRSGRVVGADLLDFKTDWVADDAAFIQRREHYKPQLALYERVLRILVDLEGVPVKRGLLFTKIGRFVEV